MFKTFAVGSSACSVASINVMSFIIVDQHFFVTGLSYITLYKPYACLIKLKSDNFTFVFIICEFFKLVNSSRQWCRSVCCSPRWNNCSYQAVSNKKPKEPQKRPLFERSFVMVAITLPSICRAVFSPCCFTVTIIVCITVYLIR